MSMAGLLKNKPFFCLCAPALAAALIGIFPAQFLVIAPPCLFSALLHWDHCWGCGMTRAGLAILAGDWSAAWRFNPLSWIVFPLLAWLYVQAWQNWYRTFSQQSPAARPL
ncbi:DUF2752 domain-containing protein [Chitinibacter sp. GC72]|uniref:DUF2752 domain-containing protein n=1 Tax=Chitinibacter sp. GC72 TaxID=1526917 RepID=UPI0012FCDC1F|nr:DUF2752 domain-containing protein [Chitinibacter sp. GC72]